MHLYKHQHVMGDPSPAEWIQMIIVLNGKCGNYSLISNKAPSPIYVCVYVYVLCGYVYISMCGISILVVL